jgi:hypothetical protein
MNNFTSVSAKQQGLADENHFVSGLIKLASIWNAKLTIHSRNYSSLTSMHCDLDTLRQIPLLEVARTLRLDIVKTGSGAYAMKDAGEITSLVLFEKTNTWNRFSGKEQGGVSHGSPIDLTMHVRECSLREACEFLISSFPQYV